ncbi:Cytochrome c-type biogenesis protein ResA [Polaromonas sp. CG9_12]|nr:Cytochrome c-type biogenesis protein ResA [Polaromonas sp. CG9_12]
MLYGGVAAAAALAGAGAAWWKFQPHATLNGPSAKAVSDAFWAASFDSPDGKPLAMASFRGKLLLVNFWATWCPPCVEELPLLDFFYQENKDKNLQIVGLAVDQPSAVRTWLQTRPLNFPVGMAGLGGTELSKSLGNTSGSLPFTVVFSPAGVLLHRKTGKVTPEELVQWTHLV